MRDAAGLRRALVAWYGRHRRAMPWRATRDPYRVWVSEIMLQQTQVATATPYYERFVAKFPDVRALARAERDDVLAAWSGLGYYRRARFLHEAALIVVREHAGSVPSDPHAFAQLPGVGRYTLGAVLSMGFGVRLPVLDGNVARVLSRLTGRALAIKRPADARVLWAMAAALMPAGASPAGGGRVRRASAVADGTAAAGNARASRAAPTGIDPGQWNQALMELGALVCIPRAPRCDHCPVRRHCVANATGRQDELPPVAARRAAMQVRRAVARVSHRGRVLVVRREGTLLDGMWEPPGVELARGDDAGERLHALLAGLGVRTRLAEARARVRHSITHRDIVVRVFAGDATGRPPRSGVKLRWAEPGSPALALTALARRVIDADAGGTRATRQSRRRAR